jgi:hypothetical protein
LSDVESILEIKVDQSIDLSRYKNHKISGWVDLEVLITFTPCKIFDICNFLSYLTKTAIYQYVLCLATVAMFVDGSNLYDDLYLSYC